jgi:hypothetical protein
MSFHITPQHQKKGEKLSFLSLPLILKKTTLDQLCPSTFPGVFPRKMARHHGTSQGKPSGPSPSSEEQLPPYPWTLQTGDKSPVTSLWDLITATRLAGKLVRKLFQSQP